MGIIDIENTCVIAEHNDVDDNELFLIDNEQQNIFFKKTKH